MEQEMYEVVEKVMYIFGGIIIYLMGFVAGILFNGEARRRREWKEELEKRKQDRLPYGFNVNNPINSRMPRL